MGRSKTSAGRESPPSNDMSFFAETNSKPFGDLRDKIETVVEDEMLPTTSILKSKGRELDEIVTAFEHHKPIRCFSDEETTGHSASARSRFLETQESDSTHPLKLIDEFKLELSARLMRTAELQVERSRHGKKTSRRRGKSLERLISQTILQTAAAGALHEHFVVDDTEMVDNAIATAEFILSDLLKGDPNLPYVSEGEREDEELEDTDDEDDDDDDDVIYMSSSSYDDTVDSEKLLHENVNGFTEQFTPGPITKILEEDGIIQPRKLAEEFDLRNDSCAKPGLVPTESIGKQSRTDDTHTTPEVAAQITPEPKACNVEPKPRGVEAPQKNVPAKIDVVAHEFNAENTPLEFAPDFTSETPEKEVAQEPTICKEKKSPKQETVFKTNYDEWSTFDNSAFTDFGAKTDIFPSHLDANGFPVVGPVAVTPEPPAPTVPKLKLSAKDQPILLAARRTVVGTPKSPAAVFDFKHSNDIVLRRDQKELCKDAWNVTQRSADTGNPDGALTSFGLP